MTPFLSVELGSAPAWSSSCPTFGVVGDGRNRCGPEHQAHTSNRSIHHPIDKHQTPPDSPPPPCHGPCPPPSASGCTQRCPGTSCDAMSSQSSHEIGIVKKPHPATPYTNMSSYPHPHTHASIRTHRGLHLGPVLQDELHKVQITLYRGRTVMIWRKSGSTFKG